MRDDLNMTPGDLDDVENATAYANRTDQRGVASERPERGADAAREAMEGAPTDNGEVEPPARSTVREGEDIGGGQHARRDGGNPQNPFV